MRSYVYSSTYEGSSTMLLDKGENGRHCGAIEDIRRRERPSPRFDPTFDGVREVFFYIKEDGFLFPWYNSAGEEVQYSYSLFHGKFSAVCRNVLKCPPEIQVGTHTMRKSAYLFASWGLLGY
jgi:hypothetical protein